MVTPEAAMVARVLVLLKTDILVLLKENLAYHLLSLAETVSSKDPRLAMMETQLVAMAATVFVQQKLVGLVLPLVHLVRQPVEMANKSVPKLVMMVMLFLEMAAPRNVC